MRKVIGVLEVPVAASKKALQVNPGAEFKGVAG